MSDCSKDDSGFAVGIGTFQYDALRDERSIRILTVHAGQDSDKIQGSLSVKGLNDKSPPYETVSYVWGSSGNTHHVLIDGLHLGITTCECQCDPNLSFLSP